MLLEVRLILHFKIYHLNAKIQHNIKLKLKGRRLLNCGLSRNSLKQL